MTRMSLYLLLGLFACWSNAYAARPEPQIKLRTETGTLRGNMAWRLCDDVTRSVSVSTVTLTPDPPVIGYVTWELAAAACDLRRMGCHIPPCMRTAPMHAGRCFGHGCRGPATFLVEGTIGELSVAHPWHDARSTNSVCPLPGRGTT